MSYTSTNKQLQNKMGRELCTGSWSLERAMRSMVRFLGRGQNIPVTHRGDQGCRHGIRAPKCSNSKSERQRHPKGGEACKVKACFGFHSVISRWMSALVRRYHSGSYGEGFWRHEGRNCGRAASVIRYSTKSTEPCWCDLGISKAWNHWAFLKHSS